MQSSTTTTHPQTTPFRHVHRHHRHSDSTDVQDANAAGKPFAFVPRRRCSSGSIGKAAKDGDGIDGTVISAGPQQGRIYLREEHTSEDLGMTQTTSRAFVTFPRAKSEISHGRLPDFDDEADSTLSDASTPTQNAMSIDLDVGRMYAASTAASTRADAAASVTITGTLPRLYPASAGPSSTFSTSFIRKKSGEPVKPSLKSSGFATWSASSPCRVRTKSAPSTPMGPKFVHFDSQLEHVKLFLAEQKPLAVSRDGSPTETSEGETTDTTFPFPPMLLRIKPIVLPTSPPEPWVFDVRLEKVVLEDSLLVGHVLVRNVSFAKRIVARFTLDTWQTTSEVTAHHVACLAGNAFDRFEFRVRLVDFLNGIETKRLILCVRYSVEGREIWDNNGGRNYEVGFERVRGEPVRKANLLPTSGSRRAGLESIVDLRKQLEKVVQDEQPDGPPPPLTAALHRRKPHGLRVWLGNRALGDDSGPSPSPHTPSCTSSPLDAQQPSVAPSLRNKSSPLSARYDLGASLKNPAWTPPLQVRPKLSTLSTTTSKSKTIRQRPNSPPFVAASTSTSTSTFQFLSAGEHRRSMTIPLDRGPTFNSRPLPRGSPRDSTDFADEGAEAIHRMSLEDDLGNGDDKRHSHALGWAHGSSYFDRVAVVAPTLSTTPPGTPMITAPTPLRPKIGFSTSSDDSSSSSSSSPFSDFCIPLDSVWRAQRRRVDESFASTPAITTSSSSPTSLSPMSAPGYLPRAASDDLLTVAAIAGLNRAKRPPINSMPYHSFLDQFCFFTGVNTYHTHSDNHADGTAPRRAHSASSVDDYFTLSPPPNVDPQSSYSFSPMTPTRSPIPAEFLLKPPPFEPPTEFPQSVLPTPVAG